MEAQDRSGGIRRSRPRVRVHKCDELRRNGADKYINLATFDQYPELFVDNSNGLLNNPVVLVQLYDLIEHLSSYRPL